MKRFPERSERLEARTAFVFVAIELRFDPAMFEMTSTLPKGVLGRVSGNGNNINEAASSDVYDSNQTKN